MRKGNLRTQKIYKWYEEDLWGILCLEDKPNKALKHLYKSFKYNFYKRKLINRKRYFLFRNRFRSLYREKFLYQVNAKDEEFKRRRRSFKSKIFLDTLKLRIFYGNIKTRPFKQFLLDGKKNKRLASRAAPLFLEGRLAIFLYRTNLFQSIFSVKRYLQKGFIFVNGEKITEPKYILSRGDIVTISPEVYLELYFSFLEKLKTGKILINYPKYLEADYQIGSFVLIAPPKWDQIYYPTGISIRSLLYKFNQ